MAYQKRKLFAYSKELYFCRFSFDAIQAAGWTPAAFARSLFEQPNVLNAKEERFSDFVSVISIGKTVEFVGVFAEIASQRKQTYSATVKTVINLC